MASDVLDSWTRIATLKYEARRSSLCMAAVNQGRGVPLGCSHDPTIVQTSLGGTGGEAGNFELCKAS